MTSGEEMETTIMDFIGTTMRIHSYIPSEPKVSLRAQGKFEVEGPGFAVEGAG